jgi:acetyl esterase
MIAAVDFRVGPEHTYPAQTADVNYATRWLKAHAGDFNADASVIGGHGSSSGGHTIMLSAMRPSDERYAELTSPDVEGYDATVSYLLLSWPVLDSYARYMYAKEAGLDGLVSKTLGYFLTEDAIQEGSPQLVLERGEKAVLPPTLIVQGTADLNVPMSIPHRFVDSYRQAGGEIELEEFPDMPHGFGGEASKDTERAIKLMKLFAGRQLAAHVAAI